VAFTIAENHREYVLVAELQREGDAVTEIVRFRREPVVPAARAALEKRLLWEQEDPILDVVIDEERMLVLGPARLDMYARLNTSWEQIESKSLKTVAARDPRGKLQVSGDSVTAFLPDKVCRGRWKPMLEIECASGGALMDVAGERVKFTPGRNTLEAPGWPPFFSLVSLNEGPRRMYLISGLDGRTHMYDSNKQTVSAFDAWGTDFVTTAACGSGFTILATSPAGRDSSDSLTAYEIVDSKPAQRSDPVDFPGPVITLWPAGKGATAVARHVATGRYAAYDVTMDCGR
jgi:hypothetical protein